MLSNVYLDPLDQQMAAAGYEMVRYADDFVILCRSQAEAEQALQRVQNWTAQADWIASGQDPHRRCNQPVI